MVAGLDPSFDSLQGHVHVDGAHIDAKNID
jgi:hypothetical protein